MHGSRRLECRSTDLRSGKVSSSSQSALLALYLRLICIGLTGGISRDLRIYDVGGHRSLVRHLAAIGRFHWLTGFWVYCREVR